MKESKEYIVIYRHEDELQITVLSKNELLKSLDEGDFDGISFMTDIAILQQFSPDYWPCNQGVIIKGKVVVPSTKEVIIRYTLED